MSSEEIPIEEATDEWVAEKEIGSKVSEVFNYIGGNGQQKKIRLHFTVLGGSDGDSIDRQQFDKDGEPNLGAGRRELVKLSLEKPQKWIDDFFHNKPLSLRRKVELYCENLNGHGNATKIDLAKDEAGKDGSASD